MQIQNNISSMNALRNLSVNNKQMDKSMEKLSSGYRINRAADDAAGLAISEKMRGQIGGLEKASKNAQDGISMIQTAEGALQESHAILQRMRDLSVQASNDTNTDSDREQLQKEVDALSEELGRIAKDTEFNTKKLLNGDLSTSGDKVNFQIGSNEGQSIDVNIDNMQASAIGDVSGAGAVKDISIEDQTGADAAIGVIDDALNQVSTQRADLGAVQNRLEHTIKNLDTSRENLQAAESNIRDTDMAKEMSSLTKNQVLQQAGTAMLSQANQKSQSVLQLLG